MMQRDDRAKTNPFVEEYDGWMRRYARTSRLAGLLAVSCLLAVVYLMMGVGRLHVGYVSLTLFAGFTRFTMIPVWRAVEIPPLFAGLRNADPEVRTQAEQAFEVWRPKYLSRFLVEQGEWNSPEQVQTMTAAECLVLVDRVDPQSRRRFLNRWLTAYVVVAALELTLLAWLEWRYRTGDLHVEAGWLG